MTSNVVTFIMAGGKGERLFPLTRDRTKPAVPFGGIYRIIDFTLSNCINSGLRHIYILTQYKSESLQQHIRLGWNILPSELNQYIELLPAQQRIGESWYLGTADAIYQNLYTVESEKTSEVLILAGDHVYKMNYYNMIDFHREKQADLTVGVVELDKSESKRLGVVEVDKKGNVIGFQEKPEQPKTIIGKPDKIYGSMGIYVFKQKAMIDELREDAKNSGSCHDFGKDIIPQMVKKRFKVTAFNFEDENKRQAQYWRDIGTVDAYYEANMDLVKENPVFDLYDTNWPIRTYQEQFPPAKTVFAGKEITGQVGLILNSLVSGGCIVGGGRVQNSLLSPNVRISSFAQVDDSIIMEGVTVGKHARIRKAIIDKDVNIPDRTIIGYDSQEDKKHFHLTESGIVVVAKKTRI
ncbi:MAG: glucose-1-phosphate adenylyltransferase [Candidatus Omnitrophota bacterium]|mgnify:CR=1 FL=1|nr:MAG: glucose-1-phosphate adenylyltransferase [Candidatus Omnitrophota bacterium]